MDQEGHDVHTDSKHEYAIPMMGTEHGPTRTQPEILESQITLYTPYT